MSQNNSNVPGMIYPTQIGMLAGNPRASAMASMTNANQLQAQANKAMSGGKYKKKYGGAIQVPQFPMMYTPQGGPGTNPNNQIQANATTATQGAANAAFDKDAFKTGGSRRYRKARKSRKSRKVRKAKKSRKSRKH